MASTHKLNVEGLFNNKVSPQEASSADKEPIPNGIVNTNSTQPASGPSFTTSSMTEKPRQVVLKVDTGPLKPNVLNLLLVG